MRKHEYACKQDSDTTWRVTEWSANGLLTILIGIRSKRLAEEIVDNLEHAYQMGLIDGAKPDEGNGEEKL